MVSTHVRVRVRWHGDCLKSVWLVTLFSQSDTHHRTVSATTSALLHLSVLCLLLAIWRPPPLDWTRYVVVPAEALLSPGARIVWQAGSAAPSIVGTSVQVSRSLPATRISNRPKRAPVPLLPSPLVNPMPLLIPAAPDLSPPLPDSLPLGILPPSPDPLPLPDLLLDETLGPVTRAEYPADSQFDVVIQSSASEIPLPRQIAFGSSTVYTVHLPIAASKPWILQYSQFQAAPTVSDGRDSGPVVRLENLARLTPPYPLTTYRPPICFLQDLPYLTVYALITVTGEFDQLSILNRIEPPIEQALLRWLRLWHFRPATRDSVPVAVEVLLAIPGDPS